jgi:hypothetical protein
MAFVSMVIKRRRRFEASVPAKAIDSGYLDFSSKILSA